MPAGKDLTITIASIPASSFSLSASVNSDAISVDAFIGVSFQMNWSAGSSPVGTFAVQGSLDGTNWSTIPIQDSTGATVTSLPVSGNSGNNVIDLTTMVPWFRLVYTRTSGSGTGEFRGHRKAA